MYREEKYEVCLSDGEKCSVTEWDTIDKAIEYADEAVENGHDVTIYHGFDEWKKCAFCGEWFLKGELNEHGDCERCEQAIRDHGGY